MKAFLHGERPTHLTDQEIFLRSRDVLNAYSNGERLHPFAEQHIAQARQAIEDETETLAMHLRVGLLNRFDDMVRRQSEIDATGRAITDVDRINAYDAIQHQMAFDLAQAEVQGRRAPLTRPRSPPRERPRPGMTRTEPPRPSRSRSPPRGRPGPRMARASAGRERTQRPPAPPGFNSFVLRYYEENPRPADEDAALAPESILLADVENYIDSLAAGTETFGTEHLERFQDLFFNTRTQDMRNFDFIPEPNTGGLVSSFRQWLSTEPLRASVIQQEGDRSVDTWLQAIYLYAQHLNGGLAPVPEHLEAFVRVRQELAESERLRYGEFVPSTLVRSLDNGNTRGGTGPPEIILSFQEWVRRELADPRIRRSDVPWESLTQDMNGYESYLERRSGVSEQNLFRLLRASVMDTPLEYTPALSRIPSFQAFLNSRNEPRRGRGEGDLSAMDIVGEYTTNVIRHPRYNVPSEILLEWETTITQHMEENRRQLYGHPRGSFSPMVERLRETRNAVRDLIYASVEYWPLSPTNPVIQVTRSLWSFLGHYIATEEEPSPEQWRRISELIAQAQKIDREEGQRQNEGWINEMARNPIPRTPQTVDGDASTVTESPPQRQQRHFPPWGAPNFPSDPHSGSDDGFPL